MRDAGKNSYILKTKTTGLHYRRQIKICAAACWGEIRAYY